MDGDAAIDFRAPGLPVQPPCLCGGQDNGGMTDATLLQGPFGAHGPARPGAWLALARDLPWL